jgi:cytochrome c oxidase subunit IV
MTQHVHPVRMYVTIFTILLVFTFTTVVVAEIELGPWNVVVALAIAIIKATLVILYFMHVKDSSSLTKLIVVAGIFWMAILFGLTFNDYLSRGWSNLGRWW